jgi:hypothetical protein
MMVRPGSPRRSMIVLAAAFFALTGLIAGLIAIATLWTTISAAVAGCSMVFGDDVLRLRAPADAAACTQRVDLIPIALGGLASGLLLATLAWLPGSRRRAPSRVVPLGAVAAVLAGVQALSTVLFLIDQGNLTAGPVEIGFGLLLLAWGVVSAAVALAAWRASGATK